MMRRQLVPAALFLVAFTLLVGVAYPLAVTAIAQVGLAAEADGSLVRRGGLVVGSALVGQQFEGAEWFHPRPSAAGDGYDGAASGASNLGPTNPELERLVAQRLRAYRVENGLALDAAVPVDAVTASASGLDPHISPENARVQAPRVARARSLSLDRVLELVDDHTDARTLGFLGERRVNVLELNLALETVR